MVHKQRRLVVASVFHPLPEGNTRRLMWCPGGPEFMSSSIDRLSVTYVFRCFYESLQADAVI